MIVAWWLSYPLSVNSMTDALFNHVSTLYWIGLPLTLGSLYLLSIRSNNEYVKWLAIIGIVLAINSLSYFYFMLPGSDQATFRGMTEYFINTHNLDSTTIIHSYFQWPSYFLLMNVATSITGISISILEFIMFSVLGFLFATALFVYYSRAFKKTGPVAVIAFFILTFYFLDFQVVPYTLAFGLLLFIFMLQTRKNDFSVLIITIFLFTGITLVHLFVPLFFIFYLAIRLILSKDKQFGYLLVICVFIYFIVQIVMAPPAFFITMRNVFTYGSDFSQVVAQVGTITSSQIDQVAQTFSRGVAVSTALICSAGFILLIIQKKLGVTEKTILITGLSYSIVGIVIFVLGTRAYPLIGIPVALGLSNLLQSRYRRITISVFMVLIILFTFVIVHGTSFEPQIFYQTKSDYATENFFINNYNFTISGLTLMHVRAGYYVQAKDPRINIEDDTYSVHFPRFNEYDYVVYTLGLGITLSKYNLTGYSLVNEESMNVIYNSGSSFIAVKSSSFS